MMFTQWHVKQAILPLVMAVVAAVAAACSAASPVASSRPGAPAQAPTSSAVGRAQAPPPATPNGAPAQGEANAQRGGGQQAGSTSQSATLATPQTSKQGPVTVEARLSGAHGAGDTGPLVFSIVLDTHSADLDAIDLAGSASLRDDRGRSVAAMRWEAPRGGHHVQGVLTFPGALPDGAALHGPFTRSLALVVTNVGDVPERRLTWDLAAEPPAN
ncbi:MAG: hypothetical protein AAB502_08990 [Chloroflexota bacterium]